MTGLFYSHISYKDWLTGESGDLALFLNNIVNSEKLCKIVQRLGSKLSKSGAQLDIDSVGE